MSTSRRRFTCDESRSVRVTLTRHAIEKLHRSPGLAFEFGGGRRWYALVGAIEPAAVLHYAPTAAVVVE